MNKKQTVCVSVNGQPTEVETGTLLSDLLRMEKPCGGRGGCGKCKVMATGELSEPRDAELHLLSADERGKGIRLACMTRVAGVCRVQTLARKEGEQILTDTGAVPRSLQPTFSKYGVAIDIGTTTLAARLYDTEAHLLAQVACSNPQGEWGADVISRIEAALSGKGGALATAIRKALDGILAELAKQADISAMEIDGMVVTGNTVMLVLLNEESVESFSHAPFDVGHLFGETVRAEHLALSSVRPDTPVYLPPCISAFVGADITCAILSSGLLDGNETAMLADIGTNGEMVLRHGEELTVCSTAAGPAFEGVGISMGMRGTVGAIDRVSLQNGEIRAHVIGDGTPIGICGSGLVDAASCILQTGALDASGFLEDDPFVIGHGVSLTQKDIRALQLAKSAICAGMIALVRGARLPFDEIRTLYIAGGFGNYLDPKNAASIGLLPRVLSEKMQTVGNAALGGAVMLLLDERSRSVARQIATRASVLDLPSSEIFADYYISGMILSEIDGV